MTRTNNAITEQASKILPKVLNVLTGKVLTAAFSFASFFYLARTFSIEEVGNYVACLSLAMITSMASNWGINEFVFRESSINSKDNNKYLIKSRRSKAYIGATILLSVVTFMLAIEVEQTFVEIYILLTLAALVDAQTISYIVIFRANGINKIEMYLFPLRACAKLLVLFAVAYFNGNLITLIALWTTVNLGGLLAAHTLYKKIFGKIGQVGIGPNEIIRILKVSSPYALTTIISALYLNSAPIIIRILEDAGDVAVYGVAMQVFQAMVFVPVSLNIAVQPTLTRLYVSNAQEWSIKAKKLIKYSVPISILLSGLSSLIIPDVIVVIFGEEYNEASSLISLLMIAYFASFIIGSLLTSLYISSNNTKTYFKIFTIIYLIYIISNIILLHLFGVHGAVFSFILSEMLFFIILCYVLFKSIFIPTKPNRT